MLDTRGFIKVCAQVTHLRALQGNVPGFGSGAFFDERDERTSKDERFFDLRKELTNGPVKICLVDGFFISMSL